MQMRTSIEQTLGTHSKLIKAHLSFTFGCKFTELWPIIHIKRSKVYHAYMVNCRKDLVETWHADGVTIIEVPFCDLKRIRTKTWRYDTKHNLCQYYTIKFDVLLIMQPLREVN